ncbi:hypothetical protein N7444_008961 [Penicillium canescens]|nr:hypothetical protein N7444_008961 [Penicillium canescens]
MFTDEFQILIIQMLFLTGTGTFLMLSASAPFLHFLIFVDNETFTNLFGQYHLLVVFFFFVLFARIIVVIGGTGTLMDLPIIVVGDLLILIIVHEGLTLDQIAKAHFAQSAELDEVVEMEEGKASEATVARGRIAAIGEGGRRSQ